MHLLSQVMEPYSRKARLYPAVLALLPAWIALAANVPSNLSPVAAGLTTLVSLAVVFLLAGWARSRGKAIEPRLFAGWGGKPSVRLLRAADTQLDVVTKRRYVTFLEDMLGVSFPTRADEAADAAACDQIYESATRWLIAQTRNPVKFDLLLRENINYGFWRNAYALRPVGIAVAILTLGMITLAARVDEATDLPSFVASVSLAHRVSVAGALVMLVVWCLVITKSRVQEVATAYAERLLECCDRLADNERPSAR